MIKAVSRYKAPQSLGAFPKKGYTSHIGILSQKRMRSRWCGPDAGARGAATKTSMIVNDCGGRARGASSHSTTTCRLPASATGPPRAGAAGRRRSCDRCAR
eukprot:5046829-Prymnesium_polylepis.1